MYIAPPHHCNVESRQAQYQFYSTIFLIISKNGEISLVTNLFGYASTDAPYKQEMSRGQKLKPNT